MLIKGFSLFTVKRVEGGREWKRRFAFLPTIVGIVDDEKIWAWLSHYEEMTYVEEEVKKTGKKVEYLHTVRQPFLCEQKDVEPYDIKRVFLVPMLFT